MDDVHDMEQLVFVCNLIINLIVFAANSFFKGQCLPPFAIPYSHFTNGSKFESHD